MKYFPALVFVPLFALGAIGLVGTCKKIMRMQMIRGERVGAEIQSKVITSKLSRSDDYLFAWDGADVTKRSDQRIFLPPEVWERYDVGDSIDLVFVPGRTSPYHRDGIFASDGNLIFDYVLLAIEFLMMVGAVIGALAIIIKADRGSHR
ncbi:hypothetical protein SAMN06265222_113113 [Neorhodopirellula lusitana]|uniref:DUF3592 domain-containing protein n=1 Tax=Neorhodopirellula lusitana TaxID=445327 RepID=A0ABY1QKP4_9BACT|nr:hypothetical protein [Neorhodopirellula lusitana]SMP70722.1 hypothetical protein SAMN06265222_113113 [Neorhodopirellula lusitana]